MARSYRTPYFNPRTPRGVRQRHPLHSSYDRQFQSTHPARGATVTPYQSRSSSVIFQSTHPARGATGYIFICWFFDEISIHAPREGCDKAVQYWPYSSRLFQSTHPARGATQSPGWTESAWTPFQSTHPARGATGIRLPPRYSGRYFNPRTPRGVRQQTLRKSREFAWLNLLICTRGRRLSIQKQTRLCSIKLSFMLFGCEPAGEGVSSWTSHATKSKVRLEGRSS